MNERVKLVNLGIVFLTVAVVLCFRMESTVLSYKIAKKFEILKEKQSRSRLLSAKYEYQVGSERIVSEASGMVALNAPKVEQVVMIDQSGLAISK